MKKTFLILAIAFTAVSANAQFLFRISGKKIKEPSYILGSVHTLPGSLLDSIPEFIEAESKCRQLYAEYDISSQQSMAQAQAAGQQAISLPEGKNIFDVLNQDQIDLLNTRFKETFQVNFTDSVMKSVWNYQPNVLITTFSLIFTSQEMQKHPELGMTGTPIDMFCINRAKERGLSFGQLDEVQPEDKLKKMRDSLNAKIDVQVDSLVAFLSDMEHRKQMIADELNTVAKTGTYWKEGDYDSFAQSDYWISQVNKQPELFKARNERWLPKIKTAISQTPTLFVFGAGHLIGQSGIIQLLRKEGYKVELIKKK